jgi:hypothetical protein
LDESDRVVRVMLLKIVRDLTSDEVIDRMKGFEKDTGMNFEELQKLFLRRKLGAKLGRIYSEWEELLNAYKGYLEEGQVDYAVEEIKEFSRERMALLTQRRMELLFELGSLRVESINDLAKKVRRNVKNVHQDLSVLRGLGFVRVSHRRGKALVPETLVKEITFIIR